MDLRLRSPNKRSQRVWITDLFPLPPQWGDTVFIPKGDSNLPYDLKFEMLDQWLGKDQKRWFQSRDKPPPGGHGYGDDSLKWETYSVRITAGDTTWSTEDQDNDRKKLPRCEVGQWDTKDSWDPFDEVDKLLDTFFSGVSDLPTRDMDCRWSC